MIRILLILLAVACAAPVHANASDATAANYECILTDHVVKLEETVSPEGFIHPGISCNAETLSVMRGKVIAGVSPWVDYFEGLRRTRYASLDQKPRYVEQITNNGGIGRFAFDAQLAWTHTILYVVTGNEAYRKVPVDIINWYGSWTEKCFFPEYFTDSHIKIGKYVYTLCSAADILRYTVPQDKNLAVTAEMIDELQRYSIDPIRKNSIDRNGYFMNQHSYAIMGYLASTIMDDDLEGYKEVVEWTTVNATAENQGRNGSIKQQIRLVSKNDKTGDPVKPNLQVVEMGRDQPHAGGNIDNLLMMAKTIEFQKTRIDPVSGTVTDEAGGISPIHFLDDRLIKGAALFAKYNLGYGLPWIPTYSETEPDNMVTYDQISPAGRGLGGNGFAAGYHYYKGFGFDLDQGPYHYIKTALQTIDLEQERHARSGRFIDSIHNYAFDFWIGLSASASDAAPDPEKAKCALAIELPPLEFKRDKTPVKGRQFEYRFVDLSRHAMPGDIYPGSSDDTPLEVKKDVDGTGYVRMTLVDAPRTMVALVRFKPEFLLRVRSDKFIKLNLYTSEDYSKSSRQTIDVPDTKGEWRYIRTDFDHGAISYIEATSLDGSAYIDFDCINEKADEVLPTRFDVDEESKSIVLYSGAGIERDFAVTGSNASATVEYSVRNLPEGAAFDSTSGTLTWTPSVDQTGDYAIDITADNGVSMDWIRLNIHVERNLQSALDYVAKAYDPNRKYESVTEESFMAALMARDLAALQKAANRLAFLSPRLADGSLDYVKMEAYDLRQSRWMTDGTPLSFGGIWGFDKSLTMDFGNHYKVKVNAFGIQARDGFPIRVEQSVVYGSNDKANWILLTENRGKRLADMQTLRVKEEERNHAYRYLRFFMPAKPFHIFEIGELRIFGERIEDYSPDYHVAYIQGYADGTFRPEQHVTRAEAVSWLAGVVDDYTDKGAYACEYTDVSREATYYDNVAYMSKKKFITADDNNKFRPEDIITRGELAGFIARITKLKEERRYTSSGVAANISHDDAIQMIADRGWLTSYSDGSLRPDAPINRAEFVTAVNRMLGRSCDTETHETRAFKDVDASHSAYREIMEASFTHPVSGKVK